MSSINNSDNQVDTEPRPAVQNTPKRYLTRLEELGCKFVDADEIKSSVSMTKLLQRDGHKVTKSGKYIKCRCPFHHENTPSFFIKDDRRGNCYGCGWYGDVIKYTMKSKGLDFLPALKWLDARKHSLEYQDFVPTESPYAAHPDTGKKTPDAELKKYIDRLLTDEWMRQRICDRRKEYGGESWSPDTILRLAQEGSLGWAGDALAFIYPRGVKYRKWPEKTFIWESEGPSIWRRHRLKAAKHVYLMESETDAISAIDAGVETDDSVAVVAISGVNSWIGDWISYLKKKVVTLAFDNDKAGQDAVKKLLPVFKGAGIEVRLPNFEEVEK